MESTVALIQGKLEVASQSWINNRSDRLLSYSSYITSSVGF